MMYEHRSKPLISRAEFIRRLINHGGVVALVILFSLGLGVAGYRALADLSWMDALLNASMILGGEGPVDRLTSNAAKLFASVYALYSGLILLVSVGILLAPVFHRIIHRFHLNAEKNKLEQ